MIFAEHKVKTLLILSLLLFICLPTATLFAATPPEPTYGTAVVDGNSGEWDLTNDFFAKMYRAFSPDKEYQSDLYLRYSCTDHKLYTLVLVRPPYNVDQDLAAAWLKIEDQNGNLISGTGSGSFAWVKNGGSTVLGWEGSATLAEGTYLFTAHIEILDGTARQTSGTYRDQGKGQTQLELNCSNQPPTDNPAITLEKATNGEDADTATGPYILVGSTVQWTYAVKNTGNVDLTGVTVTDDQNVAVACDWAASSDSATAAGVLSPNETVTCSGSGTATAGQYANIGTVNSNYGTTPVSDSDPSHYFGADPKLTLEKATNGEDADTATGPYILIGESVQWTYAVKNTGNVELTGVTVVDDNGTPADTSDDYTCTIGSLAAGATNSSTCVQNGTAVAGQYANTATVTGNYGQTKVSDDDLSHYFGADPKLTIEKATNGEDADTATGPYILIGESVQWTYAVKNTGNVDLTAVTVVDDNGTPADTSDDYTCTIGNLAAGVSDSSTCVQNGTAVAGQYANTATVTGNYGQTKVSDDDPSHYFGANPEIDLQKSVYAGHDGGASCPGGEEVTGAVDVAVTYCFVVTNTGNVHLDVGDVIDTDLGVIIAVNQSLAPRDSETVFVESFAAADLLNHAEVTGHPTDPDGNDLPGISDVNVKDEDTASVDVIAPAIDIQKTPDQQVIQSGDRVVFHIRVENTGDVALTNVVVADPKAPACNKSIGALAIDEVVVYDCELTAVTAGFTNTATVTTDQTQPKSDTANVTVLLFTKAADHTEVTTGDQVGFLLTLDISGEGPIENLVMSDTLPTGIDPVLAWTIDPAVDGCAIADGLLTCSFDLLSADDFPVTIHVVSDTSYVCQQYDNVATVSVDGADMGNASASTSTHCLHAGTIGFWRNRNNHYTVDEVNQLIAYIKEHNPTVYDADGPTVDKLDLTDGILTTIFKLGGKTSRDQMILAQLTSVKLNLAISALEGDRLVQKNDSICLDGLLDVSGISGATDFFGTATPTIGQVVDAIEAAWLGALPQKSTWLFDFEDNAQRSMIIALLTGINEGTIILTSGCENGTVQIPEATDVILTPENLPSLVQIDMPEGELVVTTDEPLVLQASLDSAISAQVHGDQLSWVSNVDGAIATGDSAVVEDLSMGAHTIELKVRLGATEVTVGETHVAVRGSVMLFLPVIVR